MSPFGLGFGDDRGKGSE